MELMKPKLGERMKNKAWYEALRKANFRKPIWAGDKVKVNLERTRISEGLPNGLKPDHLGIVKDVRPGSVLVKWPKGVHGHNASRDGQRGYNDSRCWYMAPHDLILVGRKPPVSAKILQELMEA
jgi:hypothetical protein